MKIIFCSDIHLEFGSLNLIDAPEGDVLVLAGDIFVVNDLTYIDSLSKEHRSRSERAKQYFDFIYKACRLYKKVIFVMGNHEHYHGEFNETAKIITDTFDSLNNFCLFNNNTMQIEDFLFVGSTLWTDFNNEDKNTFDFAINNLNDYEKIHIKQDLLSRNLEPIDTLYAHKNSLNYIKNIINENADKKIVVITHHAPSKKSLHPRENKDVIYNGAYSSNLDDFILSNSHIKLWIHGHTHKNYDYMIGATRIVCNPRGYFGVEKQATQFKWLWVEIN